MSDKKLKKRPHPARIRRWQHQPSQPQSIENNHKILEDLSWAGDEINSLRVQLRELRDIVKKHNIKHRYRPYNSNHPWCLCGEGEQHAIHNCKTKPQ